MLNGLISFKRNYLPMDLQLSSRNYFKVLLSNTAKVYAVLNTNLLKLKILSWFTQYETAIKYNGSGLIHDVLNNVSLFVSHYKHSFVLLYLNEN